MRRRIDRNPYLADRCIEWPDIETLRSQLSKLLESKVTPELCLLLTASVDGSFDWRSFRSSHSRWIFAKKPNCRIIEGVVTNIYLSHIAQLCCEAVAGDNIRVLDPGEFVQYIQNRKRYAGERNLATIIDTAREVRLAPGSWQNRCAVLRWRASLAVWRKKREDDPFTAHGSRQPQSYGPPPSYDCLPPAYAATEAKEYRLKPKK